MLGSPTKEIHNQANPGWYGGFYTPGLRLSFCLNIIEHDFCSPGHHMVQDSCRDPAIVWDSRQQKGGNEEGQLRP